MATARAKRIARLFDEAAHAGPDGQLIADQVEDVLESYDANRGGIVTAADPDCPESNPDCDPPGDDG